MKPNTAYTWLGETFICKDCKQSFVRASFNQIRCYECAKEHWRQQGIERRHKDREDERAKKIDWPRADSKAKRKVIIGTKTECEFCKRRPNKDSIVATEIIGGQKFWR